MKKYTLKKPIKISGKLIKELSYDFEELTAHDLMNAYDHARPGDDFSVSPAVELDLKYQFAVTAFAILKENPTFDINDIYRAQGADVMRLARLGKAFLLAAAEEEAGEDEISEKSLPSSESIIN